MSLNAHAQLQALRGHYQLHFVDRPRVTRSLPMLEKLREAADQMMATTDAKLRAQAKATLAAWSREAAAIEKARSQAGAAGPMLVEAAEEVARVRFRVARLQRLHPEPMAARPHLLAALVAEVEAARAAVGVAADMAAADSVPGVADRAVAQEQELGHLRAHLEALRAGALAARKNRDTGTRVLAAVLSARAALADLAHAVEGRSPALVRPGLLETLVHDLRDSHAVLQQTVEEGFGDDDHRSNCTALGDQVSYWQQQLKQVIAKRRQHTADELAHALGEEADAVMEASDARVPGPEGVRAHAYACLRMDELHRQLVGLPRVFGHAQHHETLAGLADCLAWLERPRQGENS